MVVNNSNKTLYFALNSSVATDPQVEVCFTTSFRSPPVLVHRLVLPPNQHMRIFIRLMVLGQPGRSGENVQLVDSQGKPVHVSVTCRSVRHSHRLIWLTGQCKWPSLKVSTSQLTFRLPRALAVPGASGASTPAAVEPVTHLDPEPQSATLSVTSLGGRATNLCLKSDSIFFKFTLSATQLEAGDCATITVEPVIASILQHLARLQVRPQQQQERERERERERESERENEGGEGGGEVKKKKRRKKKKKRGRKVEEIKSVTRMI